MSLLLKIKVYIQVGGGSLCLPPCYTQLDNATKHLNNIMQARVTNEVCEGVNFATTSSYIICSIVQCKVYRLCKQHAPMASDAAHAH